MHRRTAPVRAALGMRPTRPSGPGDALRARPNQDVRWGVVLRNGPFLIGSFLVLLLIGVAVLGPRLARENPYYAGQASLASVDGALVAPPFPPSAQYPLGSDRWG
jgi:ABC-type dipeptide/oligopeptide/nickel transport system permease subunit